MLPSQLTGATRLLELVVELDLEFYGDNSVVTEEDRRLCLQLKQGYLPWQASQPKNIRCKASISGR